MSEEETILNKEKLYYFKKYEELKADDDALLHIAYMSGRDNGRREILSRKCSNCKLLNHSIGCEIYPAAWTWESIHEYEFSCSLWTKQDD